MAKVTTPHFDLPFRFEGGQAAQVEQDTLDDVAVCIEAVLRTSPGDWMYEPRFGAPELVFNQEPLDIERTLNRIEAWEPRARAVLEEDPERFYEAVSKVRVTLTGEE